MSSAAKKPTSRAKVAAWRARKRAEGLRQVTLWVPDTRTPEFAAEARRQSRLAAKSAHAKDDQLFVDSLAEFWD
jgi:Protein  of unknown function (DUF3018)